MALPALPSDTPRVTPYTGVWIEIPLSPQRAPSVPSLPIRECGLKFVRKNTNIAPNMSLPIRECGLKSFYQTVQTPQAPSLPIRECGLKCQWRPCIHLLFPSLPIRECGLKYGICIIHSSLHWSLPIRECGLKSIRLIPCPSPPVSSLPIRECGLKSRTSSGFAAAVKVTPYTGVWIEICRAR